MNPISAFRRLTSEQKMLAVLVLALLVGVALHFAGIGSAGALILAVTAALPTGNPSIVDVQKRSDPSGRLMPVVQALAQQNMMLQTMDWKEGNLDTGHLVAAQNALPAVSWVRVNEGVLPTQDSVDSYTEACGILEGLSSIEDKLYNVNGNGAEYRSSKDQSFVASLSNTLESAFFYESTTANPERILGLNTRLGSTSGKYGKQIVLADGSASGSDQASGYLLGWGQDTVYGISPRGQGAGLQAHDRGLQRDKDSITGKVTYKWETHFRWNCGIAIEDYRYICRIANIDTGNLTNTGNVIIPACIKAYHQVRHDKGRYAWYFNKLVATFLHLQALNQTTQSTLSIERVAGMPITMLLGLPVYETDALLNNEATVS